MRYKSSHLAERQSELFHDAQTQLDAWVRGYNTERPHQSLGMVVPWDRFRLAQPAPVKLDSRSWSNPSQPRRQQ